MLPVVLCFTCEETVSWCPWRQTWGRREPSNQINEENISHSFSYTCFHADSSSHTLDTSTPTHWHATCTYILDTMTPTHLHTDTPRVYNGHYDTNPPTHWHTYILDTRPTHWHALTETITEDSSSRAILRQAPEINGTLCCFVSNKREKRKKEKKTDLVSGEMEALVSLCLHLCVSEWMVHCFFRIKNTETKDIIFSSQSLLTLTSTWTTRPSKKIWVF
jgi:hypothetical protein